MASLGTISGQIRLDVKQAVAAYAAVRAANAATIFALRGSSAAFLGAGTAATAGGIAIAAGFAYAINAAAEFERQLDFFGAVSASTEQQMEAVRAKALELGKDTIYSAGQIAESFIELGKAGVGAEQIINGVGEAVANLGAAADIPLDQAALIMTAAIQTYDLAASDAVRVTDLLAGAANASIVEVEDLGVSLKYVGGVANAVSIDFEDTVNALSLLGKAGIRGSTAGTSLRQIIVSLSGTSKKAMGVLKDLGIVTEDGANKFFTAEGKAKSLGEIFQVLQDHTAGLTEAQRLAAFKVIFNNRALAAASILAREGAAGFAEMNTEINKTTAADVAAKRLDNLSGDLEILRGNLETLAIEAGTPFQEVARQVVQFVTDMVQAFANLSPETQKLIFQLIALAGGVLLVLGPIALLIGAVLGIAGQFIKFGAALRFVGGLIWPVVTAFAGLLGLSVGPFLLIVGALVAVGVAIWQLYQRSETFRNIVGAVVDEVVVSFQNMMSFFSGLPAFFSGVWDSITSGATGGWDAVGNFFTQTVPQFFTSMVDTVISTVSGWWGSISGFFSGMYSGVTGWVSRTVQSVVDWFQQLPSRAGAALSSFVSAAGSFLAALPGELAYWIGFAIGRSIALIVGFVTQAGLLFGQLAMSAGTWLAALPGRVISFFQQMYTGAVSWVTQMVAQVIIFFQQLPGRAAVFFATLYTTVVAWVQNLAITVAIWAAQLVTGFIGFIQSLPARATAFFQQLYVRATVILAQLVARATALAAQVVAGIVSFIQQLPGRLAALFQSAVSAAISAFNGLVSGAARIAQSAVSGITGALSGLGGLVAGLFNRAVDAIYGVATRAFNAAEDVGGRLWEGFKAGLGISSPSYIERAMFQINDTLRAETNQMVRNVAAIQKVGDRFGTGLVAPAKLASLALAEELRTQQRLTAEASRLGVDARAARPIVPTATSGASNSSPVIVQAPAPALPDRLILEVDGHQFTAYVKDVSMGVNNDVARELYAGRR